MISFNQRGSGLEYRGEEEGRWMSMRKNVEGGYGEVAE